MIAQKLAMSSTTEVSSGTVMSLIAGMVLPTRTTSAPSLRSSLTTGRQKHELRYKTIQIGMETSIFRTGCVVPLRVKGIG